MLKEKAKPKYRIHYPLDRAGKWQLQRFCTMDVRSLEARDIGRIIVSQMLSFIISRLIPATRLKAITRMRVETLPVDNPNVDHAIVVISVIRAGCVFGEYIYEVLLRMGFTNVRHSMVMAEREKDAEGKVIGTKFDFSKVGDPIEGTVIVIDPMGARGDTGKGVIEHIHAKMPKAKIIVAHFIATAQALDTMSGAVAGVEYIIGRLDTGLTSKSYIEPGAGDVGELLYGK